MIILGLHFCFAILTSDCRKDRDNCKIQRSLKSTFMFPVAISGFWITPWKFLDCHVHLVICLCKPRNYTHWMKHINLHLGHISTEVRQSSLNNCSSDNKYWWGLASFLQIQQETMHSFAYSTDLKQLCLLEEVCPNSRIKRRILAWVTQTPCFEMLNGLEKRIMPLACSPADWETRV